MTNRLTAEEVNEQFQEAEEEELRFDPSDELDITLKYDARFARGWLRKIDLREGIYMRIDRSRSTDRTIVDCPGSESRNVQCSFQLSGNGQGIISSTSSDVLYPFAAGKYFLRSNGLEPQYVGDYDIKPWASVIIDIHPSVLRSFAASPEGELPKSLQHLIRPASQIIYVRSGNITPMMAMVLQQILNCSYQDLIKRAYLESKAIELVSLVLDQEVAIGQGEVKKVSLKPEQIERIHYAKEILLQDLDNPPSLVELAQQVGLNDCTLRQGFRQVFNTTVFEQLHVHRLEVAKQLLAEQDISVTEAAYQIGYASIPSFIKAFKRKFGMTPKAYQKACR